MQLNLLSWNVNGIRSVREKGFADLIKSKDVDLILLQEVKCNSLDVLTELFSELGYRYEVSLANKKGYSGTLIAWKDYLDKEISILPTSVSTVFSDEGRIVGIDAFGMRIYSVYVPSGSSSDERQQVKMEELGNFSRFSESTFSNLKDDRVLLCGDFNICHRPIDIHHPAIAAKRELSGFLPEERAWMDTFLAQGWVDTYRHSNTEESTYSWWSYRAQSRSKNLGWRIDYAFASEALLSNVCAVEYCTTVMGSDHCPVNVRLST